MVMLIWLRAGLFVLCGLLVVGTGSTEVTANESDKLVFTVTNSTGASFEVYDPDTHESSTIYESDSWWLSFQLSTTGQIAYSTEWMANSSIFLLDTHRPDQGPVDLSQEINLTGHPLAWSPDGKLLALVAYTNEEERLLYVWDGQTARNITPALIIGDNKDYDADWSYDGRLAITVWFDLLSKIRSTEIYVWDGDATYNLTPNPLQSDNSPAWNSKNELAFLSYRNDDPDIFIWDGRSLVDGAPDVNSFLNVEPDLTDYLSSPSWTPDDNLIFGGIGPEDKSIQIYLWNGETGTNISQNPDANNWQASWSYDGHWAFTSNYLYVRDAQNRTIMTMEGSWPPMRSSWSSDGDLIFCQRGQRDASALWELHLWDRETIRRIAKGNVIQAQWQSGQRTICSSG